VPVEHEPDVRCVLFFLAACLQFPLTHTSVRTRTHAPHTQEHDPTLHGERAEKVVAAVPSRL
jgi:hypothetical protein